MITTQVNNKAIKITPKKAITNNPAITPPDEAVMKKKTNSKLLLYIQNLGTYVLGQKLW